MSSPQVFDPPLGSIMRKAYAQIGRTHSVNLLLGSSSTSAGPPTLQKISSWCLDPYSAWMEATKNLSEHFSPEVTRGRSVTLIPVKMIDPPLRNGEA